MKVLKAMVSLPYARSDGAIVSTPGYDSTTGIYADFEGEAISPVPVSPTTQELRDALVALWSPWSKYPFATKDDRAAMLAAIMTAVCRPALSVAPAFFFDAPAQASGKTKCAGALGGLIRGKHGGVSPFVDGPAAEAETVKKLVSMLLAGEPFWLIDNVAGMWRSPVIASLITDGTMSERILGTNSWFRGEARMLVCATGNNASLDRDLGRRFIRVRIDPGVETPQLRIFDFDPVDAAITDRMKIARSVLVLIQAFRRDGMPCIGKGDAGFNEWNRLIRNCVLWIGVGDLATQAGLGPIGDPACSILERAASDDPETAALRMLLRGLYKQYGTESFQAKDVWREWEYGAGSSDEAPSLIRDGIASIMPGRKEITAVSIGKLLRNRRDRIADGLVLRQIGEDRNGVALWMVQES